MIVEKEMNLKCMEDGKIVNHKLFVSFIFEGDDIIHTILKIEWDKKEHIQVSSGVSEVAVIKLQKALPNGVRIICCQSCGYGNFCPYGDQDNEIFCLKGIIIKNKTDICNYIFYKEKDFFSRKKELLHYCKSYKEISDDYYTYNDWECRVK